jgi:hypothetical protein
LSQFKWLNKIVVRVGIKTQKVAIGGQPVRKPCPLDD